MPIAYQIFIGVEECFRDGITLFSLVVATAFIRTLWFTIMPQVHRSAAYNRRKFLRQTTALGTGLLTATLPLHADDASPNEKVNLAAVGVGGKGWTDINGVSQGHHVVAFCDVDTEIANRKGGFAAAAKQWPKARRYTDWREMLDKEQQHVDGITVSTPDHMHAPITMTAIQLGIATYTQKPLTRTVHEARQVRLAASKASVVTQMGNQHHSGAGYRTLVKLVRDGAIGKIQSAHAWSNRPIWPQGIERPRGTATPPANLNWDLWLGVAQPRPYLREAYHPFRWRGWFDFGAGALGDMGCHILDPLVWSLALPAPLSVRYTGPPPKPETFPAAETIRYRFPGTKYTTSNAIEVTWYDGGRLPPKDIVELPASNKYQNGCCLVGQHGMIVCPHGKMPELWPRREFADFRITQVDGENHYQQWTNAIRGQGKTTANFDYAGPLTETVLLGTIACRFPDAVLDWDSTNLRFRNHTAANQFIQAEYRKGWEVAGLS